MSQEIAGRTIQLAFVFDEAYRRQQFVEGWALEAETFVVCNLAELTREEREYLLAEVTADFREGQELPLEWNLFVLSFDERNKDISPQPWQAKINPYVASPEEVVRQWMEDYRAQKQESERQYNQV